MWPLAEVIYRLDSADLRVQIYLVARGCINLLAQNWINGVYSCVNNSCAKKIIMHPAGLQFMTHTSLD